MGVEMTTKMTKEEKEMVKKKRNDIKHFIDEYFDLCEKYNLCLTEFTYDNRYDNLHVFQANLHVPPYRKFHKRAMLLKFDAMQKSWFGLKLNEKEKYAIEEYNKTCPSNELFDMIKMENFFKEMKGK